MKNINPLRRIPQSSMELRLDDQGHLHAYLIKQHPSEWWPSGIMHEGVRYEWWTNADIPDGYYGHGIFRPDLS